MIQKTLDPLENLYLIHDLYPNAEITLYHGNNWKVMPAKEFLMKIGGKVVLTEYYDKLSPENILKKLNARIGKKKVTSNLISTKANTLLAFQDKLHHSRIEDILVVTVGQFANHKDEVYVSIAKKFAAKKIVVRSSSTNEDCYGHSNAGHYDSVLDIDSENGFEVCNAIRTVIDSYNKDAQLGQNEQVLIQTQTEDVDVSGVVLTRDLLQNRPYYVINYDDSGSTESVTSGRSGKTIWLVHDSDMDKLSQRWRLLLQSVHEIEALLEGMVLDIEFAITKLGEVVIFQVRPLAANYKFIKETCEELLELKRGEKFRYRQMTNVYDQSDMMLSDMAFWNPAELICRGIQYVNTILGCTVKKLENLSKERPIGTDHRVLLGDQVCYVNNYHNEGVCFSRLAKGLDIVAKDSENGIIEAFGSYSKVIGYTMAS